MGSTDDRIESFVPKYQSGLRSKGVELLSASEALAASRLDVIGEIRFHGDRE
jgi:hypothetical protein